MRKITGQFLLEYEAYLRREERSPGTIEKYLRDVKRFAVWARSQEEKDERNEESEVRKELAAAWKLSLPDQAYRPVTVNSMVAAVNSFFRFMGWEDCRIRFLRVQKQNFRRRERELTRTDYDRLLAAADKKGNQQLRLLMEASRVFPHNLRHLFARTFYRVCRDMARLADILGHSNIDTTRIYLATTETEQKKELNRLRLVS